MGTKYHEGKESLIEEIEEHSVRVGHLHPEHAEMEEIVSHGEIHHKRVKFGKLTVPKFGK